MLRTIGAYVRRHHIALLALFFALGGTSFAAADKLRLGKNTVGTKQIKNNAVTSLKIKNGQVTGADVRESSLSQVPSALHSDSANNALNAANAINAATAANANALGGNPASTYATSAAVGQPFAAWNASPESVSDISMTAVPGVGTFYLECGSGALQVYFKNTTNHGDFFWYDDGRSGSGLNGEAAYLASGEKEYTQGFTPTSPGSPLPGGPAQPMSSQTSHWLIHDNSKNQAGFVNVDVGVTRVGMSCIWMVKGHVLG